MDDQSVDALLGGTRIHPIWIAPEWLMSELPSVDLDPAAWIDDCVRAGVSGILLVTKQHDGRCIWPTKLDSLTTADDDLARFTAASRERGVRIVAYYSAGVDDHQAALNRSWAVVDRHGTPCRDIGYAWVCLNSPYRELMLKQVAEILENYPVDGLWLDIFSFGALDKECFCVWCRSAFAQDTGGDLLIPTEAPVAAREQWRANRLKAVLDDVRALRDRYQPDVPVTFNGAGAGPFKHPYLHEAALPILADVDYLSDEGHDPRYESAISKILRSFGKPFEVLTSGAIGNEWVGWVTKPPPLLCLESAIIGSHGGHVGVGVSVLPTGSLPPGEMKLLCGVADFGARRSVLFGPQSAVADATVLIRPYARTAYCGPAEDRPVASKVARSPMSVPDLHDTVPVSGVWDVLKESHIAFDFIQDLAESSRGQVLYVQGGTGLSVEDCDHIRRFVSDGGTLIAESHTALFTEDGSRRAEFGIADVLGVGFRGYHDGFDGHYVEVTDPGARRGLPDYPLAITGPCVAVELRGATPLARLLSPIGGDSSVSRHSAARMNPAGGSSSGPAITRHEFGLGTAIYIAADIGEHLRRQRHIDPWAKLLLAQLVRSGIDAPLYRSDAPADHEIVANRADGRLLFHVLDYGSSSEYSTTEEQTGPATTLWLNPSRVGHVAEIHLEPGHERLATVTESGWLRIDVPGVTIHSTVVVVLA